MLRLVPRAKQDHSPVVAVQTKPHIELCIQDCCRKLTTYKQISSCRVRKKFPCSETNVWEINHSKILLLENTAFDQSCELLLEKKSGRSGLRIKLA